GIREATGLWLDLGDLDHEAGRTVLIMQVEAPALVALEESEVRRDGTAEPPEVPERRLQVVDDEAQVVPFRRVRVGKRDTRTGVEDEERCIAGGDDRLVGVVAHDLHPEAPLKEIARGASVGDGDSQVVEPEVGEG